MTLFQYKRLFTSLPHVFFGAQWFFDWANRHVPRKNAFEQSTIGKSDLGEKAWCLKTASGSLLVMSNLEESTYRYGPHMDDAFSVSPANHVHGFAEARSWYPLLSSKQLLGYSSCCSGLFQSWGTIFPEMQRRPTQANFSAYKGCYLSGQPWLWLPSVHSPRFKEACHLCSNTLFNNSLFWCQFTKRCHAVGFLFRRLDEEAFWQILKTTKRPSRKNILEKAPCNFFIWFQGPGKWLKGSLFSGCHSDSLFISTCFLQGLCHSVLSSRSVVWIIYLHWVKHADIQGEV